jgi:hypothetical protein
MRNSFWIPEKTGMYSYLITGLSDYHWRGPIRGISADDRKNYPFLKPKPTFIVKLGM